MIALDPDVTVGVHAVGEALGDEAITRVYGGSSVGGEVEARVGLLPALEAGMSVGYRRLGGVEVGDAGGDTWLWYAPIAVFAGARVSLGAIDLAVSAGPTVVAWAEAPGTAADIGYTGGKWGVLVEGEARLDPRAFTPTLHDRGPVDLQLVARVGGRATVRPAGEACGGDPCGLGFGALRLSVGVTLVLP